MYRFTNGILFGKKTRRDYVAANRGQGESVRPLRASATKAQPLGSQLTDTNMSSARKGVPRCPDTHPGDPRAGSRPRTWCQSRSLMEKPFPALHRERGLGSPGPQGPLPIWGLGDRGGAPVTASPCLLPPNVTCHLCGGPAGSPSLLGHAVRPPWGLCSNCDPLLPTSSNF